MEIELKSIRFFERMSEETNAFRASLYIDGKPVGEAGNDGKGGPTWYRAAHPDYWPLIKNAEEYCKTLPPFVFGKGTPEQFEVPSDRLGASLMYTSSSVTSLKSPAWLTLKYWQ